MYEELNFRESRLGVKGIVWVAVASAAVYALIAYGGGIGLGLVAGLPAGYLVARCTKL